MTEERTVANATTDIIKRNLKRELPCALDDDEVLIHARAATKKRAELRVIEAEIAEERKKQKERVAGVEKEIARLDAIVESGKERRIVVCHEKWANGAVHLVREDTGEVVDTRQATAADRNLVVPGSGLDVETDGERDMKPGKRGKKAKVDGGSAGAVVTSSVGDKVFVGDGGGEVVTGDQIREELARQLDEAKSDPLTANIAERAAAKKKARGRKAKR
jgi:hypothetical protein